MPEGPEVKITSEALNCELSGSYITDIVVTAASRYKDTGIKNQYSLCYPVYVESVYSKGKKIIISGIDSSGLNIMMVSALAMEGNWKLHTGKHAGIELYLDNANVLYFHDTRHFGTFNICLDTAEYDFVMKDVGPDLLNDYVSFDEYNEVISNHRLGRKEICWFMMEQKYFSGIGNYILAEVLYESGILPTRTLSSLSYEDKYYLWENSCNILRASYKCGGLTIATYFSMDGTPGTYPCKVYGKKHDPYGNPVYTGTFTNGRTSHYVPEVQK